MYSVLGIISNMSSAVEALLQAAEFLEREERRQQQHAVCTPPDSPVAVSGATGHYIIHSNYTNINSTILRIDGSGSG